MTLDFNGKKVLVRVDFNVPLDKKTFAITDDTRMRAALPTIKKILESGGAVILMSHLDRPLKKLKEDGSLDIERFTLRHLVGHLTNLLGCPVDFANDCIGNEAIEKTAALPSGSVLLLENTRFHKGEEKGDKEMATKLATLGDIYINDAFGTAHRAHASTATIAHFFDKNHKAFGYLMEAEITNAERVLNHAQRPSVAIIGGAKVSDKILILEKLVETVDILIVGGGMAYTFEKALGGKIGNSLCENERLDHAIELIDKAKARGVEFLLPEDSIIADKFDAAASTREVSTGAIPDGWMGLDIGPKAIETFSAAILSAKTILWNGPMGVFEMEKFANGTKTIALTVAEATKNGAFSLVGGGDSVAAVTQMGLSEAVSYVSTGGGAMLEFLEGKELPGIAAIKA
ncbi:MAG: phosphoglycerate kinase [Saprospiraceae bacterium]|nr:phosphoglycerate kinase [Saprospiraceae bacterium]